jgi:hypothetical protein
VSRDSAERRFRMIGAMVSTARYVKRGWFESDQDYAIRLASRLAFDGYRLEWSPPERESLTPAADALRRFA